MFHVSAQVDKIKSQLIDALTTKATILMEQYRDATKETSADAEEKASTTPVDTAVLLASFYTAWSALSEWIDVQHKDQRKKYLTLLTFADEQRGWDGVILKRLNDGEHTASRG